MEQNLGAAQYLWLIPLAPFLAAAATAFMKRDKRMPAAALVIGAMAFSFLYSVCLLFQVLGHHGEEPFRKVINFAWFISGGTPMQIGFVLDSLSALMLIIVSLISLLVFIFSVGYMDEDWNFTRFFTFLSLFAGSMLGLVIANSLLLMFVFWELVGLTSYLLIGFWYFKPSASAACKKAFIVTRVGDIGFFIGLLLLFYLTGTSIFFNEAGSGALQADALGKMKSLTPFHPVIFGKAQAISVAMVLALLIFCGAVGKSGQFPLHVWLPDAMEGPTPVSALIHAATMVAAGVFLVARMYPVFELDGNALKVVAYVGSFTALMAAVIACGQFDIKRILAYSTVSQLGLMMTALGSGGYVSGMFHLFTHAFFKALLFLGAGSIIHACHHEQDIRKLGGILRKMPVTGWTYLIGAAALCGLFPMAGFWSKDEILLDALNRPDAYNFYWYNAPFLMATAASILTAFYMTRQCVYVFFGETRDPHLHPHESDRTMTVPLCVLAAGSVALGAWVGYDWWGHGSTPMHHFLAAQRHAHPFSLVLALLSQIGALTGIVAALLVYWQSRSRLAGMEPMEKLLGVAGFAPLYRAIQNKFYFDELYDRSVVWFNGAMARLADLVDRIVLDGLILVLSFIVSALSALSQVLDEAGINRGFDRACSGVRETAGRNRTLVQTGVIQHYLKMLAAGVVILFLILIVL